MSAADFNSRFSRSMGCTVNLLKDRIVSGSGSLHGIGDGCAECGECNRSTGVVGVIGEQTEIVSSAVGGLQLRWACPGCGVATVQETTPISAIKDVEECEQDPLCMRCRRASSKSSA